MILNPDLLQLLIDFAPQRITL